MVPDTVGTKGDANQFGVRIRCAPRLQSSTCHQGPRARMRSRGRLGEPARRARAAIQNTSTETRRRSQNVRCHPQRYHRSHFCVLLRSSVDALPFCVLPEHAPHREAPPRHHNMTEIRTRRATAWQSARNGSHVPNGAPRRRTSSVGTGVVPAFEIVIRNSADRKDSCPLRRCAREVHHHDDQALRKTRRVNQKPRSRDHGFHGSHG